MGGGLLSSFHRSCPWLRACAAGLSSGLVRGGTGRRKYGGEEQKEEQKIEDLQRGWVIDMSRLSRKQHGV